MDMERDGVVEKQRGQRSYITNDIEFINKLKSQMAEVQVKAFYNSMKQMGFHDEDIQKQLAEVIKKEGGA
ncbi:hypothetical protein JCM10914_4724 [Paenibacillus sp. JCM 10914]|nr:hypothetical protein JCM10914_4724 [Paenibacillus sp. JCM 10914]